MTTAKNTMGGERPRNEADAYYTPDALALAITDALRERLEVAPQLVVEPSAGDGAFVRAARATWPGSRIAATDPNGSRDVLTAAGADQVQCVRWEDAGVVPADSALIVGNPPYNLPGDGASDRPTTAERHVMLAMERLPEGGHLAFLLRLSFMGGGGRIRRLYSKHPLRALWPVTPRPSFTTITGEDPNFALFAEYTRESVVIEAGGSDGSEYGVFVWRKGWAGECDLRPLEWVAPKRKGGAA